MKPLRWSITRRVVVAVTATVAVFVGLQAVLAYLAMDEQEDLLTDSMLHGEVQEITALTLRPGLMSVGKLQASPHVAAYLVRGNEGRSTLPLETRDLGPGLYQLKPSGQVWHVAVTDTEDGRLSVIIDATESEARVHQFGWTLLGLWAICVVATLFIARGVAALAVSPFIEATRSIARLAPARVAAMPLPTDEAGLLMETFNRFRDVTDEMLARERENAADLEHEIRTPLTAIRTDAELTAVEGPVNDAQARRLQRINACVDEIATTIHAVLAASAGQSTPVDTFDLRECVDAACLTLIDRAASRGLTLDVRLAPGLQVRADQQAFLTVCRNIVRNAIEHAAPATLTISGDEHRLSFADDGPGIAAAALPHLFERYQRGHRVDVGGAAVPGGLRRGLGLAIAKHVCDLHRWRLRVVSPHPAGPGTRFDIEFGAAA